jgi:hypothetical protein
MAANFVDDPYSNTLATNSVDGYLFTFMFFHGFSVMIWS